MKKYPNKSEYVTAEDILINYTLFSDLKLYEIDSKIFFNHKQNEEDPNFKIEKEQRFCLNQVKLSTKMSLALEAERVL